MINDKLNKRVQRLLKVLKKESHKSLDDLDNYKYFELLIEREYIHRLERVLQSYGM